MKPNYNLPSKYCKIFPVVLIFAITACVDLGINSEDVNDNSDSVSFENDIQILFNERCIHCHPNSGNLDLSPGNSYNNLVNVVSHEYIPALRVIPGESENSVLWNKISGTDVFGQRMPADGTLNTLEILIIENWIREGAFDN
jgi:hypothetical protein